MTPTVLRACEATTVEGPFERALPVLCGEPGRWWEAPSGRRYVLCAHHVAVFAVVQDMLAAEEAQPCP